MSTLLFAPACTSLVPWAATSGPAGWVAGLFCLVAGVLSVAALREILIKAGRPGWAALVPVYDLVELLRVAGRPWWWLFLLLIPVVNAVAFLFVCFGVAQAFGRSRLFALGLLTLAPACQLILAYGSDRYVGTAAGHAC